MAMYMCPGCGKGVSAGENHPCEPVLSYLAPAVSPLAIPVMREEVEMPVYTGDKTERISVFKDDLEKELRRSAGLDITHNVMQDSRNRG